MQRPKRGGIGGIVVLTVLLTCAHASLWGQGKPSATRDKNVVTLVPFVGCESDGHRSVQTKRLLAEVRGWQSLQKQADASPTTKRRVELAFLLPVAGTASGLTARMATPST